jgi:hypothetical protein
MEYRYYNWVGARHGKIGEFKHLFTLNYYFRDKFLVTFHIGPWRLYSQTIVTPLMWNGYPYHLYYN